MLYALLGSIGVGAIAVLVQTIRLANAKTEIVKQKSHAEVLAAKVKDTEKALVAAEAEISDSTARYRKVMTDTDVEIHRLQELLNTCQDPKVIRQRLVEIGKLVKVV